MKQSIATQPLTMTSKLSVEVRNLRVRVVGMEISWHLMIEFNYNSTDCNAFIKLYFMHLESSKCLISQH